MPPCPVEEVPHKEAMLFREVPRLAEWNRAVLKLNEKGCARIRLSKSPSSSEPHRINDVTSIQ